MKLKEILIESFYDTIFDLKTLSGEKFANILAKAYYNDWVREKIEYGDEYPKTNDFSNYLIGGLEYDMETGYQGGQPDFIYNALKKENVSDDLVDLELPKNCGSYQHGCYYNALDFMLRTDREDVSLAYGFFVDSFFEYYTENESKIEGYSLSFNTTLHSFILTDNKKIFDPTLPHDEITNEYYIWETIPKSVYEDFNHEFNDDNYDASDFVEYIRSQIQEYKGSMNLEDRLRKIHEKRKSDEV